VSLQKGTWVFQVFSPPFFPASPFTGCQDGAAHGREPSQAGWSRDEPHCWSSGTEDRVPRVRGHRLCRQPWSGHLAPGQRGSRGGDGQDEHHRCCRAPSAITHLCMRGCIATNFISARFLSVDTYSGWLGSGHACVCLPALGFVQQVRPAPGLRSLVLLPLAVAVSHSQQPSRKGKARRELLPLQQKSFASSRGREVFAPEVPRWAWEALHCAHGLRRARSASCMGACAGTWSEARLRGTGACPERGVLCCSPSPSSQEAEGLPQTDLLISLPQLSGGRHPQLSPLLPSPAPGA